MEKWWRKSILEHVPHGEEASMNLNRDDAFSLINILLNNGYAVCLTGGDLGDEVRVSWLYAGDIENLEYPDYNNVVFTSMDYLDEYPEACCVDAEGSEENE